MPETIHLTPQIHKEAEKTSSDGGGSLRPLQSWGLLSLGWRGLVSNSSSSVSVWKSKAHKAFKTDWTWEMSSLSDRLLLCHDGNVHMRVLIDILYYSLKLPIQIPSGSYSEVGYVWLFWASETVLLLPFYYHLRSLLDGWFWSQDCLSLDGLRLSSSDLDSFNGDLSLRRAENLCATQIWGNSTRLV